MAEEQPIVCEPESQTRYHRLPPNKGFVAPLHRRQVRDAFGSEFFASVHIIERHYEGARFFGAKRMRWSGSPIACVTFPMNLDPDQEPDRPNWSWYRCRPSLYVYAVGPDVCELEAWPDMLNQVFETIRREWKAWAVLPDTGRLVRRIILFTLEDEMLKEFLSPL